MRALVTVASRHDGTREVATAIARTLESEGLTVDLLEPASVSSVQPYDVVVLGSAVYAGRWLPDARDLAEREAEHLRGRRVWLFSSGPIGNPPKPEQDAVEATELKDRLNAVEHRTFEGRLDRSRLGRAEKLIVSVVRAEPGDFRPWEDIVEWARSIAARTPALVDA